MALDLFFSCGELSGDLALAVLFKQLQLDPKRLGGVCGPHLKELPVQSLHSIEGLQVMGWSGVLRSLPLIQRHMEQLTHDVLRLQPKVVLCSDYPAFHLRWAKRLRQAGYRGRLIQYICPTIWAWKSTRLITLERYFDEVWGILPFESPLFQSRKLRYRYVGNPSLHLAMQEQEKEPHPIPSLPRIGLFPGSRRSELKRHLPLLLKAAQKVQKQLGYRPIWSIALAANELRTLVEQQLHKSQLQFEWILPQERMRAMRRLDAALAVSGTVCLELALRKVPYVATYETGWLNYAIAKYLFKLNLTSFTLPNLILGRAAFPEVMGPKVDPEQLAGRLTQWLQGWPESKSYLKAQQSLGELWQTLEEQQPNTSELGLELGRWLET